MAAGARCAKPSASRFVGADAVKKCALLIARQVERFPKQLLRGLLLLVHFRVQRQSAKSVPWENRVHSTTHFLLSGRPPFPPAALLSEHWRFWARQGAGCDQGGGDAGSGADAQRPARSEMVGNPTNDRCADRCSPERNANPQGHHSARIAGSVESCMMLLVPLVKITPAALRTMSAAPNDQYPGARAARVQPSPKTAAPTRRDLRPGFF